MKWFARPVQLEAQPFNEPQDYGFMYGHGFQDLDGHIWELAFMEASAIEKQA